MKFDPKTVALQSLPEPQRSKALALNAEVDQMQAAHDERSADVLASIRAVHGELIGKIAAAHAAQALTELKAIAVLTRSGIPVFVVKSVASELQTSRLCSFIIALEACGAEGEKATEIASRLSYMEGETFTNRLAKIVEIEKLINS